MTDVIFGFLNDSVWSRGPGDHSLDSRTHLDQGLRRWSQPRSNLLLSKGGRCKLPLPKDPKVLGLAAWRWEGPAEYLRPALIGILVGRASARSSHRLRFSVGVNR